MDKYVPRSLQHHLAGGKITYTDIIRYDPKLIASPPFRLPVESIPPVFSNRVYLALCAAADLLCSLSWLLPDQFRLLARCDVVTSLPAALSSNHRSSKVRRRDLPLNRAPLIMHVAQTWKIIKLSGRLQQGQTQTMQADNAHVHLPTKPFRHLKCAPICSTQSMHNWM